MLIQSDFTFLCDVCNAVLEVDQGGDRIYIEPCDDCVNRVADDAYDVGHSEGYDEGYSEGFEDGKNSCEK